MRFRKPPAGPGMWATLGGVLLALAWAGPSLSAAQPTTQGQSALKDHAWVRVSYAKLLDDLTTVRTGQPLSSAVRDPAQRGAVQPFIDQYAYLLQYAVEMINGPDPLPHVSVTEHYRPGEAQPAWVALFRGGRLHAVADGKDHVRLFLQGEDPDTAYAQHYSVVRHCLAALAPQDGKPLKIEVYAYQHDYAASEFRLNTRPSRLQAASFPPKTKALDLAALSRFFERGATIEGAQLSRSEGFVLYGKRGERQTLSGQPVSLSDLAVAYRAAFHAGDNAAFVSLDENPDPTKVTVNFGGFLENTHIGSVVLQADKRFKTITSGIDPDSQEDVRDRTRKTVPTFQSASERDVVGGESIPASGWAATRLWFYPDQAGVETDPGYEFAAIISPQFTADAERSRKRFVAPSGSDASGGLPSPGIRESLRDLNTHYAGYAAAFPELRELSTVARLMAIVSWLLRADPDWLDLDGLLAVELPPCTTEKERTNLLVATVLSASAVDGEASSARVIAFTPVLDRTVRDYFGNAKNLASYLAACDGASEEMNAAYEARAAELLAEQGAAPVRSLVRTRSDVRALLDHALSAEVSGDSSLAALQREIETGEQTLDRLQAEIAAVKSECERASGTAYNQLVEKHNDLVREYGDELSRQRARVVRYNAGQVRTRSTTEILGGIDLDPRSFQILTPAQSARLAELQGLARQLSDRGALTAEAANWLRSQAAAVPIPPEIAALPGVDWEVVVGNTAQGAALTYAKAALGDEAWGLLQGLDGSWQATLQRSAAEYLDSSFEANENKLDLRKVVAGKVIEHLIGGVPAAGLILFERPEVQKLLKPLTKPLKWIQDLL